MNQLTSIAPSEIIPYARLKALLDSSLDVICSFDKEGRFLDANSATLGLWGYHPEELRGKFYINMVMEEDRALTIQAATDIMSGVDMTNFENHYCCADGSIMPIVWSARWDEQNEIMYCVARNATEKKKAEQQLKAAERKSSQNKQLFELFMKNSPLLAWITDIEGVMHYMNPMYLQTYGFTDSDFDKSIFDLFDKATADTFFQNNIKVIYNNQSIEVIEQAHYPDGSPQTLKIIKFPIYHGNVVMCAGWAIDITIEAELQKQLEQNLERYYLVNEATSDAIYDWDLTTNTIHRGKNFQTVFGYSQSVVTFEYRLNRIHPDDVAKVEASIRGCITDGKCYKWIEHYRFQNANGEYRSVIDKGFVVRKEGKAVRVIGAISDVTEQKRLHDELVELNQCKNRLMSIIAHDLRSPLSGCATYLDYVVEEYDSFSREDVFEHLGFVQKSTNGTLNLLQEMLLWAQNQMDKVEYTPEVLNLEWQIKQVVDSFSSQCAEKHIQITTTSNSIKEIETDGNMFRTILRNLLSNAIKFSPLGSTIRVDLENKGSNVLIHVVDQGMGMSQEVKDKLLKGLNDQASFGTKGEKGIGLGLNLTKAFIEKCGGSLHIKSEIGQGSSFSVTFPQPLVMN